MRAIPGIGIFVFVVAWSILVVGAAEPTTQPSKIFKVVVTAEQAPIMKGKEQIATAKKGDVLTVTTVNGDWYGVYPSQGWIRKINVQYQPGVPGETVQMTPVVTSQLAKELTLDLSNKVAMKLALIPAGKFMMGSSENEKDRDKDEAQHEVTISKPFYMGVTHVTVDQFAAFVKDSGYKTDAEKAGGAVGFEIKDGKLALRTLDSCSWRNPGFDQKGDHPVVQVSWNDAKAFCDWLSKKSGRTVVLPTEAKWEYACRAGTKTVYPWGDTPDDGKGWANCGDHGLKKKLWAKPNSELFSWDDGYVFTSPVGSFKANAFGLYDMIGNALQWCQDRYGDYEKGAITDPTGADAGLHRVLRGGSAVSGPQNCRSAYRLKYTPGNQLNVFGFRVSMDEK